MSIILLRLRNTSLLHRPTMRPTAGITLIHTHNHHDSAKRNQARSTTACMHS